MTFAERQVRRGVRMLAAAAAIGLLVYCFVLVLLPAVARFSCCPVFVPPADFGAAMSSATFAGGKP